MTIIGRGHGGGGHGGGHGHGHGHGHHGRGRGRGRGPGWGWGPGGPWWWADGGPIILEEDDEEYGPILQGSAQKPDLPPIWRDAKRSSVEQRCMGSALGKRTTPSFANVALQGKPFSILVVKNAVFRSEQPVEAFIKPSSSPEGGSVVLIQPVEMRPGAIAKCSSLYTIGVPIPGALGMVQSVILRGDRVGSGGPPTITVVPKGP